MTLPGAAGTSVGVLAPQVAGETTRSRRGWIAPLLCVGLLLVFSQGWVPFMLSPDSDPEGSDLIRAAYFPWYAVAAGLLAVDWRRSANAMARTPLIWLLVAIAAASTLWSIAPGVTERRVVAVAFTTLAGVAIAARADWPELAEVLASAFAILAVSSLLIGLVWPVHGRMSDIFPGSWRGVYFDKNGLGDAMSFGCMACAAAGVLNPRRRALWFGFAGLAVLLVLLSQSKTSLVSLLLGAMALMAVGLARRGPAAAVVVVFVGVVALALTAALLLFDADAVLGLLGKDATLTGRTKIWAAVLNQIHQRPWTGFGYGAVWNDTSGWGPLAWIVKQSGFRPRHSHDGWLEIWLGLGYAGLAVWAAIFVQTLLRALVSAYRSRGAYLALPILVIYGLVTLTESVVFVYNDFDWLMFTLLSVRLACPPRPAALRAGAVRRASVAP